MSIERYITNIEPYEAIEKTAKPVEKECIRKIKYMIEDYEKGLMYERELFKVIEYCMEDVKPFYEAMECFIKEEEA